MHLDPRLWRGTPRDVVFDEILPRLPIDLRLALRVPPRKLCMKNFGSLKERLDLSLRHRGSWSRPNGRFCHSVMIPLAPLEERHLQRTINERRMILTVSWPYRLYPNRLMYTICCVNADSYCSTFRASVNVYEA